MTGAQTIPTPSTVSWDRGYRRSYGNSRGPNMDEGERSPCFYVFHSLSPKSGGQVPIDHQAKAATL